MHAVRIAHSYALARRLRTYPSPNANPNQATEDFGSASRMKPNDAKLAASLAGMEQQAHTRAIPCSCTHHAYGYGHGTCISVFYNKNGYKEHLNGSDEFYKKA